jgi:hypothetical protein
MVEFSRIWSTTPAPPRQIHLKHQTRRTAPDDAWHLLAVFAVFCSKLSASEILIPAEILGADGSGERKSSQPWLFCRCF